MKSFYLSLLFSSLYFFYIKDTSAQTPTLQFGKPEKTFHYTQDTKVIGWDSTGFYIVNYYPGTKDKVFLEKYDKQCNRIFMRQLVLPVYNGMETLFEDILLVNGQLVLFTSVFNKKENKSYAIASKISNQGIVESDVKLVDESSKGQRMFNNDDFKFVLSVDSSKVLVFHEESQKYSVKENYRFGLTIIDKNLDIKWKKAATIPFIHYDAHFEDFIISKDNKIHILLRLSEGDLFEKDVKPTTKYYILSYTQTEEELKMYSIFQDKFVSSLAFISDKNNNIICAGLFSYKHNLYAAGSFYLKINTSANTVETKTIKDFSAEVLEKCKSDIKTSKIKNEIKNYGVRKLILHDDGSITLIGEEFYDTYWNRVGEGPPYYYKNTLSYKNILFAGFKPDGELNWVTCIKKLQVASLKSGASLATGVYNDKIFLFYNDLKVDKTGQSTVGVEESLEYSNGVVAIISTDGSYTTKAIYDNFREPTILRPYINLPNANGELIVKSEKKETLRYIKLKLE
ncbi:MAG: hypothetical protein EOP53_10285 [Sphingobacteriales bacterium]|nr:MAG: hypothetical protein EOP53_10285 [Sphingobacteriales bacterium]